MSTFEEIKEYYLKFPDRSNFIPIFDGEGKNITLYYCDDDGYRKAFMFANTLDLNADFQETDQSFILEKLEDTFEESSAEFEAGEEDFEDASDILSASYEDAPVIKLVNQIIISAVKAGASDIHFETRANSFLARFRIDGKLRTFKRYPKSLHEAVVARIKVMAMLDVAEGRRPQDGRINVKVGNRNIDMRVSVIPSIYGEKVVLRILEKSKNLLSLDSVGMSEEWVKRFEEHINKPNGIILVTGPTGSGKTTTLYAALLAMNRQERNILTIEDPVEYDVDGITQVQVNKTVGLDFASAIRSFLRQDPDVILVGEIRDDETAKTAVQASLTGHLVLSTLHTNDAPSAVARLVEMDIEPFLISSSLSLVAAQRLVRKNCPHCSETVKVDDDLGSILENEGISLSEYKKGKGCQECFDTGYKGRLAIFEFLEINDSIRKLINRQSAAYDIRETAKKSGFKSMFYSGMELVKKGITTPEEILATTRIE